MVLPHALVLNRTKIPEVTDMFHTMNETFQNMLKDLRYMKKVLIA